MITITGNKVPFTGEWIYFVRTPESAEPYDTFVVQGGKLTIEEMLSVTRGYAEALGMKSL